MKKLLGYFLGIVMNDVYTYGAYTVVRRVERAEGPLPDRLKTLKQTNMKEIILNILATSGDDTVMAVQIIEAIHNLKDFETAARPLIAFMAKELHPHHTAVVTSTSAELSEGVKSVQKVFDYIPD